MSRSAIRLLTIVFLTTAFLLFLNGCVEITDELENRLTQETKRIIDELTEEAREEVKREIKDILPIIEPVKPIAIEKPATPVLINPASNVNVDGSNFSFQWQKTPYATSYLLSVRRVSDNAMIIGKKLMNTSFTSRLPNDGHTYRWRVIANGPGGWGPPSEWQTFTCGSVMKKPVSPTLISPADKSSVSGNAVVFQWAAVEDADRYYLYCLNTDTEKVMIKTKLGNVTSYTAQGFANDGSTRYLWRVFAGNNHDWGEPSATWSFISGKSPDKAGKLSAPVLSVPAANANMPGDAISFKWGSIPAATGYGLTIQRLADHKVIVNIPVKGTTHRQGGFPNDGNQYRWRVAAYNQGDWGPASEWRIFTNGSVSPPPKPVLIAPKNNERVTDRTVTFSWQGSQQAKGYWLVVERVSDGAKIVNEEVKTTSYTKSGFPDNGTQFRWQVFAHGSGGWSQASGWHTFTSGTTSKPAPLQLKSPGNNATLGESTITFSWSEVKGADKYQLRIRNASTNATVIDETMGNTTKRSVSGIPLDGSKYQWQVFAGNSSGRLASSEKWSFQVSKPAIRSPVNGRKLNSGFIPNRYLSNYYYNGKPIHDAHLACDYESSTGDLNIYAFAEGEVVSREIDSEGGYYLVLKHNINGKVVYSMYLHLAANSWTVKVGNEVPAGHIIATMGNTGVGGSVHLHFAIAEANLFPWWKPMLNYARNVPANVDFVVYPNNGVKYYNPERVLETNGAIIR